ncbi:hypothetical protein [Alistipes sp.]|uniref:hypothetical protein n=1 Tax=Alistipes sp. TaxID=1872444 RepID=UPI003AEF1CFD
MSKLKSLREARASVFTQIDELRTAADGREMTAEEQQRWNDLLSDYDKADKAVEDGGALRGDRTAANRAAVRTAHDRVAAGFRAIGRVSLGFQSYLLRGATGITSEH